MTAEEHRRLQRVIAEAASPAERALLNGSPHLPEDNAAISERRASWLANVSPGRPQTFERMLLARGLDEAAVPARLADIEPPFDADLLPWAKELETLLAACAGADVGDAPMRRGEELRWPLLRALAPIDRWSEGQLHVRIDQIGLRVTPRARRQMLDAQLLRLHRAAFQALSTAEDDGPALLSAAFPCGGSIQSGWLEVFGRYPALGRLLAEISLQWRAVTSELLQRLAADRATLERRFNGGRPLGALAGYSAGGDVHEGGRAVTVLAFAGGTKLVYKPKDIRVAAAFMHLVRALNGAGLPLDLHTREIVANCDYAWEEFVAAAPCTDREQVARYYVRCGMLLRLLQALRGSDFHYENILATGEYPVAIDLEMLLQPELTGAPETPLQAAARREHHCSPLSVGMLPWKALGDPGRRAADFGVLLTGGPQQAPYKSLLPLQSAGQPRTGWHYATLNSWPCLPTLRGRPVGVTGYVEQMLAGYRAMAACLRTHAAWLSRPVGPVGGMGELPVRIVLRSSNIYARLLEESYGPEQLRSGLDREFRLERLWHAYARAPQTADAIAAEVEALRAGVIPTFTTLPGSVLLTAGDGSQVAGVVDKPALPGVLERLRSPDDASLERDVDVICSALSTALPAPRHRSRNVADPPSGGWLDHAASAGDELLALALPSSDGALGWFGLAYTPWAGAWRCGLLDDSLLGAGGIALVLAGLARATGAARFRAAAGTLLEGIGERLGGAVLPPAPAWIYCGPFYGPLAGVYPLLRGARWLDNPSLAGPALAALRNLDWDALLTRSPVDLISGRAGLLLALLYLPGAEADTWRTRLAESLQSAQLPDGSYPPPPYPPGAHDLDALPGTAAAVALALSRWDPAAPVHEPGAAPATTGDLLACLALASGTHAHAIPGAGEPPLALVTGRLRRVRVSSPAAALLDGIELALAAGDVNADGRFRRRAARLARELLRRHAGTGRWFADSLAADRHKLSAVHGVAAVAHAFLRLHGAAAGSIRLLA